KVNRIVEHIRTADSRELCDTIDASIARGQEDGRVEADTASVVGEGNRPLRFQKAVLLELGGSFGADYRASLGVIVAKLHPGMPHRLQVLLIGGRPVGGGNREFAAQ